MLLRRCLARGLRMPNIRWRYCIPRSCLPQVRTALVPAVGSRLGIPTLFLAGPSHALLWEGSAKSLVDLHPAGWDASFAVGTDGDRQVGWRERHTGAVGSFATMWGGSPKGWVDLHNATYDETHANGISGDMQVGFGFLKNAGTRAVMWRDTAASIVSLHPEGFDRSWAWATDGIFQAGFAQETNARHAALWSGTAKSHIDLHPSGYLISEATGVAGAQQVGRAGAVSGAWHAGLWQGAAASFVDLNPGKGFGSQAHATNGLMQVGEFAAFAGPVHASVWMGTAGSMLDLHITLPAAYHGQGELSRATGIDEFGNIVGWATHVPTGANHAILWRPVPELSSVVVLGLLTLFTTLMRRTRAQAFWAPTVEMPTSPPQKRAECNVVALADGRIALVGGTTATQYHSLANTGVNNIIIYNPATNTYDEISPIFAGTRMYHSTAIPSPTATIFMAGGEYKEDAPPHAHKSNKTAQEYYPDYFDNDARPIITSAPGYQAWNTTMSVTASGSVDHFSLLKLSSTTHANDMTQRYIKMTEASRTGNNYQLKMPKNGAIAPPGVYMLFAVSPEGFPSVAKYVRIGVPLE